MRGSEDVAVWPVARESRAIQLHYQILNCLGNVSILSRENCYVALHRPILELPDLELSSYCSENADTTSSFREVIISKVVCTEHSRWAAQQHCSAQGLVSSYYSFNQCFTVCTCMPLSKFSVFDNAQETPWLRRTQLDTS